MFIQAFVMGIFIAAFDIRAHAVFFNEFSNDYFAYAYVVSGILGTITFFIYSLAFKRMPLKLFAFINYSIVAAVVIAFEYLPLYFTDRQIIFLYLAAMFPLNLLLILTYWRVSRKLFKREQSRRITPVLDIGLFSGIIVTGFLVMGMLYFVRFKTLIPIIYASLAFFFGLQFIVNIIHHVKRVFSHEKERYVPVRLSLFMMFTSKYTFFLYLFGVLSAVIAYILHFNFLVLTKETYPHIIAIAKFYALFLGCLYIMIIIVDRAIIKKILWSYDSPYSIILIPVGIALALVGALFLRLIFKNTTPVENFTFFFILIGLAKLSFEAAKHTIQIPSLRALYETLDIRYRQIIFPRAEGSIVMTGMIFAGLIIIGLYNMFGDLEAEKAVIFLVLITLILIIAWFFITFKLIKTYQKELRHQISRFRLSRSGLEHKNDSFEEKIHHLLVGNSARRCKSAMVLSERLLPVTFERNLEWLITNPSQEIKEIAIDKIRQKLVYYLLPHLEQILNTSQNGIKEKCNEVVSDFNARLKKLKDKKDIEWLVNSPNLEDRILAADVIGSNRYNEFTNFLINLSREFEPEVKFAAVRAMARLGSKEHSYLLIEYLNSPVFSAYAYEALIQIGEPALDFLERTFVTPGNSDILLNRIVRIYGKIGGGKAIELLLGKIENQNKSIAAQAIQSLKESKFQANATNINRILNLIVKHIGNIAWNHLIHFSLRKKNKYALVRNAFVEELEDNYKMLFDLLSMAYNANSIGKLRELILNGNRSDISHAIELMDQFIYDDIKQVLFPIIENNSEEEKINKLQYYYPVEKMKLNELISSVITRDYNALSLYPRACAMISIDYETGVSRELIANLFHPNKLIRDTAAVIIQKTNPHVLEEVSSRLESEIYDDIMNSLDRVSRDNNEFILTKYEILKQVWHFNRYPENLLILLADAMEVKFKKKDERINLDDHKEDMGMFFIIRGNAIIEGLQDDYSVQIGDVFYRELIDVEIDEIVFTKDSEMCTIRQEIIDQLILDYPEISMNMIEFISTSRLLQEKVTD